MDKRYIGALMIAPFIIFVFLGGYYLEILSLIISLIGIYEFYNVTKKKNFNPIALIGYIATIIYYLFLIKNSNIDHMSIIIVLCALITLSIPVIDVKYNYVDCALTLLAFIYVSIFFSYIPMIDLKAHGNLLIWLVFITSFSCDTCAYYTGKAFGKNKLCPKVSPKKTVEGSIGGVVGSAVFSLIYGIVIQHYFGNIMPIVNYFIIGLICGVVSQFGDLVASSIKRAIVDVKDYSNLIPGHGGILDRFDSILYSSVIIFYYLTLIVKI